MFPDLQPVDEQCTLEDGPASCGIDTADPLCTLCNTPIIINPQGRHIALTSRRDGVDFDFDGDGLRERVAWTVAGATAAFLVLDRNGNGHVDDGSELFGNRTPQPPVSGRNGFLALAVCDRREQGGDDDGYISASDRFFNSLRLWTDGDHDGVSDESELAALGDAGVEGIDLAYWESKRHDRFGNLFRHISHVKLTKGRTFAVDVIFTNR